MRLITVTTGRVTLVVMTVDLVDIVHGADVQKLVMVIAIIMERKLELLKLVVLPPVRLHPKVAILVIVI
mgnify:CR=1 FL=1